VVDRVTGTTRTFPFAWRRSLPHRFLPPSENRHVPTFREITSLALSPDGRTLVVTEWLNTEACDC